MSAEHLPKSEIILYQTEDGGTRLQVRLEGETVWLSLNQLADLFQRDKSVISRHIKNLFSDGELVRSSVIAESATTAADGKTYQVEFYNLDLAERQARSRRVMTMAEWIAKLDDFMRISDREILTHAGHVTHETAQERAEGEFEKFRRLEDEKPSPVEQHFHEAIHRHAVVNSLTFFAPNDHPMANRVEWLVCWIRRLVFCFSRRLLGGLVG